ncbi:KEOPS complex subunit Pcc1 [Methanobrevibacter sp.]|uniref:KEOPS complex subunit Pcc1 n=1 Tax=Methanobrevibacter sp. TaxID=66852 RepID=UPI0026E08485|nr:KEOPS complex subunit Pcc1 [Methanobrevibacter sp.]MDO5823864.1 KEOPS complex subunit Pcc1 [Methanobrevibacter sp.]
MKIKGKIHLNYKDSESAKLVFDSLEIDNENYLKSELKENEIIYKINSKTLGSFLSTADDLIASEIVVEKILGETQ